MPYGQLQCLALLGRGARGLRPGERGQFATALGAGRVGEMRRGGGNGRRGFPRGCSALRGGGGRPSGPGRTARPLQAAAAGRALLLTLPLGEDERFAEGAGGGVVLAQDGQAVGEQAVQIRLVARHALLGSPYVALVLLGLVRLSCFVRTSRFGDGASAGHCRTRRIDVTAGHCARGGHRMRRRTGRGHRAVRRFDALRRGLRGRRCLRGLGRLPRLGRLPGVARVRRCRGTSARLRFC